MKNLKTHLTDFFANVLAKVIVTLILLTATLAGVLDIETAQAAVQWLNEMLSLGGSVIPPHL